MAIPRGVPWVWLPTELLASPAYRELSLNARRIFDFLLIEHQRHGGYENGRLKAPYDQLERFGLSRRLISQGIAELSAAGLVKRVARGGIFDGERHASLYLITLYPDAARVEPATNAWRDARAEQVEEARRRLKRVRSARAARRAAKSGTAANVTPFPGKAETGAQR